MLVIPRNNSRSRKALPTVSAADKVKAGGHDVLHADLICYFRQVSTFLLSSKLTKLARNR
jgi:hypothetical protein